MGKKVEVLTTIQLAMLIKIGVSLGDTGSDMNVAYRLWNQEDDGWKWAIVILLIDYLPAWQVLVNSITTGAWKELKDHPWEKAWTVGILLLAPISFPLFQIRFLWNYLRKAYCTLFLNNICCLDLMSFFKSYAILKQ